MATVSVIMAVYNSQEYLPYAIRSVLNQDYKDFELVLVDDGSTDGSGRICDEYALNNPQVRVLHKPNGGMCEARNYALDRIDSTYVAFCDNDDRYFPGLLSDNLRILEETGVDYVYYGRRLAIFDKPYAKPRMSDLGPKEKVVLRGEEIRQRYDVVRGGSDAVWACIYRRDVLEKYHIRFDERLRHGYEDTLFNLNFLKSAKSVATNPKSYYLWLKRLGHSSSFVLTDDYKLGHESATQLEDQIIQEWGVDKRLPSFCADRMTNYLLNPLERMLLMGKVPYEEALPTYEWVADYFAPFAHYVPQVTSLSRRTFYELVLKRRFRLVHAAMNAARLYVDHTKRG
ncbi:MAG: glycosyltransferase family 2 protein [Atopobiaceae bacterium]|nr:glycosyltransferase family 2 protein [Atopobiaceae bacterium]